jgi:hypothetical protein
MHGLEVTGAHLLVQRRATEYWGVLARASLTLRKDCRGGLSARTKLAKPAAADDAGFQDSNGPSRHAN